MIHEIPRKGGPVPRAFWEPRFSRYLSIRMFNQYVRDTGREEISAPRFSAYLEKYESMKISPLEVQELGINRLLKMGMVERISGEVVRVSPTWREKIRPRS